MDLHSSSLRDFVFKQVDKFQFSSLNKTMRFQVQLESCKQDLAEKGRLVSEASQALEILGKQMAAQKVNHKEQLKMLEDKMNEVAETGLCWRCWRRGRRHQMWTDNVSSTPRK